MDSNETTKKERAIWAMGCADTPKWATRGSGAMTRHTRLARAALVAVEIVVGVAAFWAAMWWLGDCIDENHRTYYERDGRWVEPVEWGGLKRPKEDAGDFTLRLVVELLAVVDGEEEGG